MDSRFLVPERAATYEEKIKRSVFIASLEICNDEKQARDFLTRIVAKYRDATHNCRAYIIDDGAQEYSSDDGEPSGTAGKPILNAIKKSGLVNVMVIVTRYFGGVKLGTRGLIDAYGSVAAKALELAGCTERVLTSQIEITFEYGATGVVNKILESSGAINLLWKYGGDVDVRADVPVNFYEKFLSELNELKARKIIKSFVTS